MAAGVSVEQYALELVVSAITLSFNYHLQAPFSTYGESAFILAQNIIIVLQIRSRSHASKAPLFACRAAVRGRIAMVPFIHLRPRLIPPADALPHSAWRRR